MAKKERLAQLQRNDTLELTALLAEQLERKAAKVFLQWARATRTGDRRFIFGFQPCVNTKC
jgi:hypothetical protein